VRLAVGPCLPGRPALPRPPRLTRLTCLTCAARLALLRGPRKVVGGAIDPIAKVLRARPLVRQLLRLAVLRAGRRPQPLGNLVERPRELLLRADLTPGIVAHA